jgi:cob(I)alamin adenosyltransferase
MGITTKKGDKGTTSICQGTIGKDHQIIQVLGSLDEANCFLGLSISFIDDEQIKESLREIQKDILLTGSIIYGANLVFPEERLKILEYSLEKMEKKLPSLNHFILPGGSKEAGLLHVTRAKIRAVERDLVLLKKKKKIDEVVLAYYNRLSDYLFLLARLINYQNKIKEIEK